MSSCTMSFMNAALKGGRRGLAATRSCGFHLTPFSRRQSLWACDAALLRGRVEWLTCTLSPDSGRQKTNGKCEVNAGGHPSTRKDAPLPHELVYAECEAPTAAFWLLIGPLPRSARGRRPALNLNPGQDLGHGPPA